MTARTPLDQEAGKPGSFLSEPDAVAKLLSASYLEGGTEGHEKVPSCFGDGLAGHVYMLSAMSLGVGVFSLPQVLTSCGWALGTGLLALFAVVTYFTGWETLECSRNLGGVFTYEELASRGLGGFGLVYLTVTMGLSTFIGNASHIETVGDMLGNLMYWFVTDSPSGGQDTWEMPQWKRAVIMTVLLAAVLPFCFQKTIRSLEWIGTLSVLMVCINGFLFIVYCLVCCARGDNSHDLPPAVGTDVKAILKALGNICFTYTSILSLFPVLKEMPDRTKAKAAFRWATIICFLVYLCVALLGCLVFGIGTQENSLYNIKDADRGFFRVFWLLLVFTITLLYPVINYPMVVSVQFLVYRGKYSREIISTVGAILTVVLTMVVPHISDMFSLCGSLGLGSVVLVIPSLIYLAVDPASLLSAKKIMAIFSLIFGLFIVTVSTTFTIQSIAQGK